MEKANTIKFTDRISKDEAYFFVKYNAEEVIVSISLKTDGDIEVAMTKDVALKLIESLKIAVL